jgi:hypothetical protein
MGPVFLFWQFIAAHCGKHLPLYRQGVVLSGFPLFVNERFDFFGLFPLDEILPKTYYAAKLPLLS